MTIHPRDLHPSSHGLLLARPHLDNSSEAKHTSNFTFKHSSFSPASVDKDVKRQALEMQATLQGAPGHALLWGHRLWAAKCLLGGWEAENLLIWVSWGPPVHKSSLEAWPMSWSSSALEGCSTCCAPAGADLRCSSTASCCDFPAAWEDTSWLRLLNDAFNSAPQKMLTDRTWV